MKSSEKVKDVMKFVALIICCMIAAVLIVSIIESVKNLAVSASGTREYDKAAVTVGENTIIFNIEDYSTNSIGTIKLKLSSGDCLCIDTKNCVLIDSDADSFLLRKLCYGGNAITEDYLERVMD